MRACGNRSHRPRYRHSVGPTDPARANGPSLHPSLCASAIWYPMTGSAHLAHARPTAHPGSCPEERPFKQRIGRTASRLFVRRACLGNMLGDSSRHGCSRWRGWLGWRGGKCHHWLARNIYRSDQRFDGRRLSVEFGGGRGHRHCERSGADRGGEGPHGQPSNARTAPRTALPLFRALHHLITQDRNPGPLHAASRCSLAGCCADPDSVTEPRRAPAGYRPGSTRPGSRPPA